jgi:hypothetical protein
MGGSAIGRSRRIGIISDRFIAVVFLDLNPEQPGKLAADPRRF